MSSPRFTATPASVAVTPKPTSFTVTNTTVAKVVVEPFTASPEVQGTTVIAPVAPFAGGATLLDLVVASTDASNKDIILWLGKILTTQSAAPTGAITLTAQNKLSRVNNSWITDGWLAGDLVMAFTPVGTAQVVAAIDGILGVVTTVTALDLTATGTPWAAGSNVLTGGTRIVNVSQLFRTTVTANAGNTTTASGTPSTNLLNNSMDGATIRTELKLGADSLLIAGMQANVSALPAAISLSPRVARY